MDKSSVNQQGAGAPLSTPASLPIPPTIKPTSRARTYRIPNTSDAAAGAHTGDHENAAVEKNATSNNHHATSESFLWATREIAALDFLMNVPLKAEREIVRAGLSGERWQCKHAKKDLNKSAPTKNVLISYETQHVVDEENIQQLSAFDGNGSLYVESETNTTTTGVASALSGTEHRSHTAGGRWWERLILKDKRFFSAANQQMQRRMESEMEEKELERPTESPSLALIADESYKVNNTNGHAPRTASAARSGGVPGRRLDGRDAPPVSIPTEFRCRPPKTAARQAAVREWEIKVAWDGISSEGAEDSSTALLDARVFFSAKKSYPVAVFSTIKYEPQKEAAARRRKKLEELGGGGTQFVLPERDWRGISYRALLPNDVAKPNRAFNRLLAGSRGPEEMKRKSPTSGNHSDSSMSGDSYDSDDDGSESSSEDSGTYVCGFIDDPEWVSGRHRHVMVGDKNVGPIVSSTIQFVKPSELKRELNNKFRERFDGWEPPKSQRKYIGAKVIEGTYTLMDPTETTRDDDDDIDDSLGRQRSGSIAERNVIRMPPSLTLSKIRSLKQQALMACIRSKIEISTLALACVYFERLCLDCRVDKSNRRLSFAASLLLAAKMNESNSMIAFTDPGAETNNKQNIIESFVKPSRKSTKIFESLVVFFTHDWSLSLKELFAAEWIVFTSLGFSLKARPSEVAFHFRRLLRVLEWNARSYLGSEMYRQWQDSLVDESLQKERREARRERMAKKKDRKLLRLQRKLHQTQAEEASSRRSSTTQSGDALETPRRQSSTTSLEDFKAPKIGSAIASPRTAPAPATDHVSPSRRGSLFSRLARPKNASYGKDLDKVSKEKEITHSASVPDLRSPSLVGEKMDLFHTIHESEHEGTNVTKSDDGFFV